MRQQRTVQERHVHTLALPRPLAVEQRGEDALTGHERADRVEHRRAAQDGQTVGLAHDGHETAHGLHEHVHPGLVAPRSLGAERGERAVDQPRIQRRQSRPVDAEALGDTTAIRRDDHVGAAHEAREDRPPLGAATDRGSTLRLLRLTVTNTALSSPSCAP